MRYRVQVTMDEATYLLMKTFAERESRTPPNLVLHALRGYMSRYSTRILPGHGKRIPRTGNGLSGDSGE